MTEDEKQRLIEPLEVLIRRVKTGDVKGLMLFAFCGDGGDYVCTSRRGSPPPPHAILILQEYTDDARRGFLEANLEIDDGKPQLRVEDGE